MKNNSLKTLHIFLCFIISYTNSTNAFDTKNFFDRNRQYSLQEVVCIAGITALVAACLGKALSVKKNIPANNKNYVIKDICNRISFIGCDEQYGKDEEVFFETRLLHAQKNITNMCNSLEAICAECGVNKKSDFLKIKSELSGLHAKFLVLDMQSKFNKDNL